MKKILSLKFLIFALFLLSGCKDPTYSSENTTSQIDSFVELLYATPQEKRKTFFELYVFYTLPYINEKGERAIADIHNLDGLTADEVMQVTSEHYDMVDYQSQHGF